MRAIFTLSPVAAILTTLLAQPLMAQEQPAQEQPAQKEQKDALDFEKIMVTGVARATNKMDSSVSASTLNPRDIEIASPRTTAEIFRAIPGVRSESTGGEGNANIAVRGLPVAAGGAKFLLLEEDGLPVMQFGDIAFGNADIFLRADSTISGVEVIRGGSASTMVSNSPGGIINFTSKTGEFGGGSVATTLGLDYGDFRTDFEYGDAINDSTRFHVGGFFREGEGPRNTGYNGNSGGQIKANLTKEFDSGYVRLYFKHLDDKSVGYLPMPMYANGDSIPGFDAQQDTPHTAYLQSTLRMNGENQISSGDLRNGMHPEVFSFGFEASFDVGDNWKLENRFRRNDVSGQFVSLFPATVDSASAIASSIAGSGASLIYASGPQAGQAYTDSTGNGLAMKVISFDVEMNDFNSYANDFKLIKAFDQYSLTLGYYKARQNIDMSWLWNSYVMEVKGDNAAMLDVADAGGDLYSENGQYAFGTPDWGYCCQRRYNTQYDIDAPYLALSAEFGDLSVDASVRRDMGNATGSYAGAVVSAKDMNGDGSLSKPEENVASIDLSNPQPVDYDWSYTSYSLGANYRINQDMAAFARLSRGGRANADRLLFGKVRADGSVAEADAVDMVKQYETGLKYRHDGLGLFATAFFAETEEQNFEATSQKFFDRVYQAKGLELEAAYFWNDWTFKGGVTWTNAEITKDAINPDVVGNVPRRQADFIYQLTAAYTLDHGQLGVNLIGTTDAYAQDNNDLAFDGYTQVNAFASYYLTDALSLSLNVNNLFDQVGITEAEEGSVPANGIIRARTINGRTSSLTLKYTF